MCGSRSSRGSGQHKSGYTYYHPRIRHAGCDAVGCGYIRYICSSGSIGCPLTHRDPSEPSAGKSTSPSFFSSLPSRVQCKSSSWLSLVLSLQSSWSEALNRPLPSYTHKLRVRSHDSQFRIQFWQTRSFCVRSRWPHSPDGEDEGLIFAYIPVASIVIPSVVRTSKRRLSNASRAQCTYKCCCTKYVAVLHRDRFEQSRHHHLHVQQEDLAVELRVPGWIWMV